MHNHQPAHRRRLNYLAMLLAAIAMLVAMTAFSAPEASAHSGKFEHDDAAFADTGCPEGTVPNGATAELFGRQVIGCDHPGYSPILGDVPLCEEARGFFVAGLCTFDRARPCGSNPAFLHKLGDGTCLRLAEVLDEFAPNRTAQRSLSPVCIETDLVQENAYSGSVGGTFSIGGNDYLIVTGSTCTFNCSDGWDINCDGKLGDFCPIEYDLTRVVGVGQCLQARAA